MVGKLVDILFPLWFGVTALLQGFSVIEVIKIRSPNSPFKFIENKTTLKCVGVLSLVFVVASLYLS